MTAAPSSGIFWGALMSGHGLVKIVGLVIALALVPACSRTGGGGATPQRGAAAQPAVAGNGKVILSDDFSDPASGFIHKDEGDYGADYRDGRYEVWVDNDREEYVASVGQLEGRPFADGRIGVTATPLSLPDSAGVGVLCRASEDGRSYYSADVESDGSVRILRYDPDQSVLARGQVAELGKAPVKLKLDCVGHKLALWVNGVKAAVASDDSLAKGDVGFTAGGASQGVTRVAFDDLVVRAP